MSSTEFSTKHEQIIQYIESLDIGTRISVRKVAQELEVSEGTAYRAMKDAENRGIVVTKERAGTIRIEKKQPVEIDRLTFSEITNIVDGNVLGGEEGLHKTLKKFVIGAMQLGDMIRYIEPGNLLIVGNREKAHYSALTLGAGILVTGGFDTTDDVKALADELKLPVISTHYDTFTVATMINRAISDKLIKKKIVHVMDAVHPDAEIAYLRENDRVNDMLLRISETNHSRFPVVNDEHKPIGIITAKDIIGAGGHEPIHQYMSRNPLTVTAQTAVATAGHMMVRESLELLPIVSASGQLTGVISRKDVLRSLQNTQLQPHYSETLEEQIWSSFKEIQNAEGKISYEGFISASMINPIGNLSDGILSCLINQATTRVIAKLRKGNLHIDSTAVHYFLPVEIESTITLVPAIIESSRRFCKVSVDVYEGTKRIAQAIVTARLFEA